MDARRIFQFARRYRMGGVIAPIPSIHMVLAFAADAFTLFIVNPQPRAAIRTGMEVIATATEA